MSAPQRCVEALDPSFLFSVHQLHFLPFLPFLLSLVGVRACVGQPCLSGLLEVDFSYKIQLQKHFAERQERSVVSTVGSEGNWPVKARKEQSEMITWFLYFGKCHVCIYVSKIHQNVSSRWAHVTACKFTLIKLIQEKERQVGLQTRFGSEV